MSTNIKATPELELIQQLAEIRRALTEERESLLSRVASIDEALGVVASRPQQKHSKGSQPSSTPKTPKAGGIKDAVLVAVTGTQGLTIKEIQTLVSEASPKSVEAVVHGMASAGQLTRDGSTPKKFSLAKPAKSNGAIANGA